MLYSKPWPPPKKQKKETGLMTTSAGIPYTSLERIAAIGLPTFGLFL